MKFHCEVFFEISAFYQQDLTRGNLLVQSCWLDTESVSLEQQQEWYIGTLNRLNNCQKVIFSGSAGGEIKNTSAVQFCQIEPKSWWNNRGNVTVNRTVANVGFRSFPWRLDTLFLGAWKRIRHVRHVDIPISDLWRWENLRINIDYELKLLVYEDVPYLKKKKKINSP